MRTDAGSGAPARSAEAGDGEPRRQARGERRIAQILQAAARVLGEHGYERATTNAIAAEAGISPGSLYQFFKNKDEIVAALARRYADALADVSDVALEREVAPGVEISAVVDGVLEPLVEFNAAHPGFKALFARSDMPATLTAAVRPVQEVLMSRVTTLVGRLAPGLDAAALERASTMSVQIVKAAMPLVVAPGADREALTAELRAVLTAYLETLRSR